MKSQVCEHLSEETTNATGFGCAIPGNCTNLYNDVYCPIKHLLYNCSNLRMEFVVNQHDPIEFHCECQDVLEEDWVCPVKGNRSVKCPLRAKNL